MEKERRIKVLSMMALIVAVLGLTVAFASLSQTLTINGTASVNAAGWDIHFENLIGPEINGDASVSGEPILSGTTISGLNMIVTKPNDSIIYTFDIVNAGTIDAKISSIEISTLCTLQSSIESCDWDNDGVVSQTDVDKVNSNISLIVATVGEGKNLKVGDLLNASDTKSMYLGLGYYKMLEEIDGVSDFDESTELPKRDLIFSNLTVSIKYEQLN